MKLFLFFPFLLSACSTPSMPPAQPPTETCFIQVCDETGKCICFEQDAPPLPNGVGT